MAIVTGLTAERMIEMEAATVIDGNVVGDDLILVTRGGTEINVGSVRGPQGEQGETGPLDQATADGLYINTAGDTMVGALILPSSQSGNVLSAIHKQFADTVYAKLTGATLTGDLIAPRLRATSTSAGSATSTLHALQVGLTTGDNIIMNGNQIRARRNGVIAELEIHSLLTVLNTIIGRAGQFGMEDGTAAPMALFGPNAACYMSYYAKGDSVTRSAYIGFPSSASFYINNEYLNGSMYFLTDYAFTWTTGTTASEKMRLTTSGELLVGKTTTGALNAGSELRGTGMIVSTQETLDSPNVWCTRLNAAVSGSPPSQTFITFRNGSTQIGEIAMYGTTATSYNTTSDYRLKDDLGPIPDAASRLLELQPKRVRWKETGVEMDGFLAHEVQPVVPEAVTGEKDAVTPEPPTISRPIPDKDGEPTGEFETVPDAQYPPAGEIKAQQLDSTRLVPLLVAALQEALDRITALEARLA